MGLGNSQSGKATAAPSSSTGPRETARGKTVPVAAPADTDRGEAPDSTLDKAAGHDDKPGFLKSHFGNPEAGEVYGTGNDYETEEEQIKTEKVSANQSLWYIGVFTVLVFLGYLFFT